MRIRHLVSGAFVVAAALIGSSPALAGAFPANQGAVAVAVGAAFVLPALVAGLFALLLRASRALGPVLSTFVCVLALLILANYLQPGLLAMIGI